jgi:putative acetyltransferase
MSSVLVRTIEPADNKSLAIVVRNTLAEFGANHSGTVYYDPTTDALFELFQEKRSVYYVALMDNTIMGGAGIFPSPGLPSDTCELVKMYLFPQARGHGIGKMLIEKALQFAQQAGFNKVYLETMPELKKAMKIYEQFGFQYLKGPMGKTGHTGCAIWMIKNLES